MYSERKRRFAIWIATVLSAPIIYIGFVFLFVLSIEYYPKRSFDQKEWLTNKDERYELSDYIIDNKILIGKTKADIKRLLGDEGNKDEDNEWYYELGIRPGIGNIDPDGLVISFKNDKVAGVVQHKH